MSRIDVVGQNGNDGIHYEYELDKSTGEVVKKYVDILHNNGFKQNKLDYSPEFMFWYERVFCQSPRMCKLEYDDEKMWEAWKAATNIQKQLYDSAILASNPKGMKE